MTARGLPLTSPGRGVPSILAGGILLSWLGYPPPAGSVTGLGGCPLPPEWTWDHSPPPNRELTNKNIYLITARVHSTREGNVLTRVCPSTNLSVHGGGYPYPIMLCNISQNAMRQRRGVTRSGTPPGGVPGSGTPPGGTRSGIPPWGRGGGRYLPWGVRYPSPGGGTRVRYPPGGVPGGTPPGGFLGQVPPRGVPGSGTPPGGVPGSGTPRGGYPGRTTEGVLTTRRAVCLLRSRRRTFLFENYFQPKLKASIQTLQSEIEGNHESAVSIYIYYALARCVFPWRNIKIMQR